MDIPGLHQKDGQGVYDQVISKVAPNSDVQIDVLPINRAVDIFKTCENCCYSPGNKDPNFYDYDEAVVETEPMNVAKVFIFSAFNQQPVSDLSNLIGRPVGVRHGMPYGSEILDSDIKFELVNRLHQNFMKLERGRVDAVLAYAPDVFIYLEERGAKYPYDPSQPAGSHRDGMVCRGVPDEFIRSFDEGIRELRQSGEIKEILGINYVEP